MILWDDGIRLEAVLERPGTAPGPLVIQIHGFTGTKDRPHNVLAAEAMREAGFATLRVDMYGHGGSGGEFRRHTLYKWISNIMTVMEEARRWDFVTEIWLSGHSQGGLTAALVAGMEPERVKGLILRAPAFMIPRCAREGEMLGVKFDRIPDEVAVMNGQTLEGGYIRVARTLYAEDAMDAFPGPVLILHGDEDSLVPVEESVAAQKRYRRCRLEIIRGESHHFDRHSGRMKELIREWLEEQRAWEERK